MNVLEASGDPEGEGSDYLTGRKKSRLKSFKSRLFGKIRRKEDDGGMKQSQSESDISWSVEDSDCSKSMLGSRAFSHDSIFQAEHSHSDPEPVRILSQESIHGKVRALQMKLQQQKLNLGPPPLLLPIKRREDLGGSSEDDGLPRSPSEVSRGEGLYMSISDKFSVPPKNHSTLSLAGTGSEEEEQASGSVDFSTPPQFTSLLDNSAARHRMSLKPKNQRASAKNKRATTSAGSRARAESLNNLDQSLTTTEEETLVKEIPRARSYSSQVLRGERLTTSQINSPVLVSPLMSLHTAGDSRKVSAEPELERNILSTSPPSPSLRETTPAVSPVAKLPIPVVPIDKKGKAEVSEMPSISKLLKNSQSTIASTVSPTVRPSVTTTPELSPVKDEKSNDVLIETKTDKYSVQNAVNIENRPASAFAPTNVICGINLRPSSLRRNIPSTDEKQKKESGTLQPVSTALAISHEDHTQTESIKRQRTVSGSFHFSVSSDKNQERPRTASFTGVVGQAGLKKEPPSPVKPPLNFKIERQVSSQVEKMIKDTCPNMPPTSKKEDKTDTSPVMPTKFTDLPKSRPRALDVEESQDNEKQEIGLEATEEGVQEVEVAEEAREDVMEDVTVGKEREATNAFGVKLRSTSLSLKFRLDKAQSEDKVKCHSVEVSAPISPSASQSDSTSYVEPEDQCIGLESTRVHAELKDPPLQTDASSTSVHSFGSPPKSFCRDNERAGILRQAEPAQPSSSASKSTKIVPSPAKEDADLPPEETTAVYSQESAPTSTASEVSWMEMAREKTRSLQQLFTSRLPEFPSLQSRPTTLTTTQPQSQTSTLQANPRITQTISSQPTTTQPLLRPPETKPLPSAQHSGRSTQSTTQMMQTQTKTTTSQPSANSTQTTTSQSQIDSAREVQFQSKSQICNSTTKPTQSTVTCTSTTQTTTVYTAKQPSQALAPQTPPIQPSSPLRAASQTPTQAILRPTPPPGYPHLSSSPKLTSHLVSQQSANTVSKDQPQNEEREPTVFSGKADRASASQGKGTRPEDGRPVWAAGSGNKTSLLQRWENQTTAATKTGEQKSTADSQTTSQSTVPLRPISKVSGTGFDSGLSMQASVSSVPTMSADRENKWQQKSVPPSSSSPLQSVRDSAQPSWMELAKRKSLAWSDKTMD
ncbi:flocculation protein FLO11-like [Sinocyclocheilus rhinocerous]|uniref:flocculation protein FLO11-like n=1 Tax=Sinocyclocheilus rhinocerous TaxID=307959 RepID=UPI0007B7BD8E|nr:PREDICTED: flocculation protein FLO11-like [Sinocyclocheilus rhinocerous]